MGNTRMLNRFGALLLLASLASVRAADVTGARANIGGGHTLTGNAATITGGSNNIASAIYATIGGGRLNSAGASSAFIGAGQQNSVAADYAVVVGGTMNTNVGTHSFIGAGSLHTVLGTASGIASGYQNINYGDYSFIGAGYYNEIQINPGLAYSGQAIVIGGGSDNHNSGPYSVIGGGQFNIITNSHSVVGGGANNYNYSRAGVVGGGEYNWAWGPAWTTVGGGGYNHVTASSGTVSGGFENSVSAENGTVPGGSQASATLSGQMAYANGGFSLIGDAQTSLLVARRVTTNATPTELFLDGTAARMTIVSNYTWTFDALVSARSGANSAGYRIVGVIENNAGTTSFVGTPTVTTLGEDVAAWNATAVADNVNDALVIQVTGGTNTTVRWVGSVRTTEVGF